MCVLFLLTQHVRSSLLGPDSGGRYQIRMPSKGCDEKDLLLTVVGVEPKEGDSSGAPFYNGRHVTPRGCCCSVKQDHQFLTKIFYSLRFGQ